MRIYRGLDEVGEIKNAVVTTGSFDGVHVGHKVILNRLSALAKKIDGESVLLTFHPHPRIVLFPETAGKTLRLINTQREKIALLEKTGLDNLVIIPFTKEFSEVTSFDFIRKILVGKLHARTVVVGFNHHFGHKQEGGFEELHALGKYHGFTVEEIPQQDIENETVSSTRIRKALEEGKIQRANAYLDHYYMIMGTLSWDSLNNRFNLKPEEDNKLIPPPGHYAVSLDQEGISCKALLTINPGGHGEAPVSLLPLDAGLRFGVMTSIYFHKQIRDGLDESNPVTAHVLQKEIEELIY
jgi:riboflavin kinase/FMN adenylyltransferase